MNLLRIFPRHRYWGFTFALVVLLASGTFRPLPAAGQEAAPLVIDADQVTYDESSMLVEAVGSVHLSYRGLRLTTDFLQFYLRSEVLTAQGHVVLVDAQGRELRGERVTYDVRAEHAEVVAADLTVDGVHIRAQRMQRSPNRITAEETVLSTCDLDRPAYRITAAHVEVFPGDRLVAHQASLWLGSWRMFTVPTYAISLRDPAETARSFPRIGYNAAYGFWLDYRFFFRFGDTRGSHLRAVLGTRTSGLDLSLKLLETRFGSLPLVGTVTTGAGFFHQVDPLLDNTRTYYGAGLSTLPLSLGPATTWESAASWEDASYGAGDRQGVLRINSDITHRFSDVSSLRLSYDLVEVSGATPFAFDTIDVGDRVHTISLQFAQNTLRTPDITATVTAGIAYNFRDQTPSVNIGYGEREPGRYHWGLGTVYNLTTQVVKFSPDVGVSVGTDAYLTVQAVYNTSTSLFEDLDYIVAARVCGCIDVSVKYRQMRQEIWLEVGLSAFPEARLGAQSSP